MKIGFIGLGKMGSALASGAVRTKALSSKSVLFFDPNPTAGRVGRKMGFRRTLSLMDLVLRSDLIFLCVKPQQLKSLLKDLRPCLLLRKKQPTFVSIVAGATSKSILKGLRRIVPVVRIMPNTPALVGKGMSGVTVGRNVPKKNAKLVLKILNSVGKALAIPESKMDAVTAVSGSGPAYAFALTEAIAEAAKKQGFPNSVAQVLARQVVIGAGALLEASSEPAGTLRKNVTSPGGTTEAALSVFQKLKFQKLIQSAVKAAAQRSKELGKDKA